MNASVRLASDAKPADAVTQEDIKILVRRAAGELLAEGTPPTPASIRVRIGQHDAQEVERVLHEWWRELAQRVADHQPASNELRSLIDAAKRLAPDSNDEPPQKPGQNAASQEAVRLERERRFALLQERVRQMESLLTRERNNHSERENQLKREIEEHTIAHTKSEARHKVEAMIWREQKAKLIKIGHQQHRDLKQLRSDIGSLKEQLVSGERERESLIEQIKLIRSENFGLRADVTHSQEFEETLRDDLKSEITVDPTRHPPRHRKSD